MANKYFSGEKAPREEAISKLMQHVAGLFDGRFLARITSDDGGPNVVKINKGRKLVAAGTAEEIEILQEVEQELTSTPESESKTETETETSES